MKYIKKPVVIKAFQYDGDLINSQGEFYVPKWAEESYKNGIISFRGQGDCFIRTARGDMSVRVGDYIIKGTHGEIYSCELNTFETNYEEVKED